MQRANIKVEDGVRVNGANDAANAQLFIGPYLTRDEVAEIHNAILACCNYGFGDMKDILAKVVARDLASYHVATDSAAANYPHAAFKYQVSLRKDVSFKAKVLEYENKILRGSLQNEKIRSGGYAAPEGVCLIGGKSFRMEARY